MRYMSGLRRDLTVLDLSPTEMVALPLHRAFGSEQFGAGAEMPLCVRRYDACSNSFLLS